MTNTPAILAADRAKFEAARAKAAGKNAKAAAAFEIGQLVRNRPGSIIGQIIGFEGSNVLVETDDGVKKISPTFLKLA